MASNFSEFQHFTPFDDPCVYLARVKKFIPKRRLHQPGQCRVEALDPTPRLAAPPEPDASQSTRVA